MAKSYAHSFWHVTMSGTLYGGADIWVCGFHLGHPTQDTIAPAPQHAADIAALWKTAFTDITARISNQATTTLVRISHIAANGTTILQDTVQSTNQLPCNGAANFWTPPPQSALAVSFKASTVPKGPGANGRMYLPPTENTLDATGRISNNDAGQLGDVMRTFFNGVNAATNGDGAVLVNVGAANPTRNEPAMTAIVNSIRIGSTLDTIRRRRNRIKETYTTRPIP